MSGSKISGSMEETRREEKGSNEASIQEVAVEGRLDELMDYLPTLASSTTKPMGDFPMPVSC